MYQQQEATNGEAPMIRLYDGQQIPLLLPKPQYGVVVNEAPSVRCNDVGGVVPKDGRSESIWSLCLRSHEAASSDHAHEDIPLKFEDTQEIANNVASNKWGKLDAVRTNDYILFCNGKAGLSEYVEPYIDAATHNNMFYDAIIKVIHLAQIGSTQNHLAFIQFGKASWPQKFNYRAPSCGFLNQHLGILMTRMEAAFDMPWRIADVILYAQRMIVNNHDLTVQSPNISLLITSVCSIGLIFFSLRIFGPNEYKGLSHECRLASRNHYRVGRLLAPYCQIFTMVLHMYPTIITWYPEIQIVIDHLKQALLTLSP